MIKRHSVSPADREKCLWWHLERHCEARELIPTFETSISVLKKIKLKNFLNPFYGWVLTVSVM